MCWTVTSRLRAFSGKAEPDRPPVSGPERLLSSDAPPALERGAELGQFNLGSTIVMLFPRSTVEWDPTLTPGQSVRMGQALGRTLSMTAS